MSRQDRPDNALYWTPVEQLEVANEEAKEFQEWFHANIMDISTGWLNAAPRCYCLALTSQAHEEAPEMLGVIPPQLLSSIIMTAVQYGVFIQRRMDEQLGVFKEVNDG